MRLLKGQPAEIAAACVVEDTGANVKLDNSLQGFRILQNVIPVTPRCRRCGGAHVAQACQATGEQVREWERAMAAPCCH